MISKKACLTVLFVVFGIGSVIAPPANADLIICRDGEKKCRVIVILPDANKVEYAATVFGGIDAEEEPKHRGGGRN